MKKLLVIILVGAAVVYGVGRFTLSEQSAEEFLVAMDVALLAGDSQEVCDRLHEDAEYSVTTQAGGPVPEEGGREEFCDYLGKAAAMLTMMKGRADITVSRDGFTVQRDWKHPWTAHYTFNENTSIRNTSDGATLNVDSEQSMTLVMTLTGLKLRKAVSTVISAARGS